MAVITDNTSYCKKAWKLIEDKYKDEQIFGYGCVAHVLNLFCQDILKIPPAKMTLDEATQIVKAIKQSHILWEALKAIQNSSNNDGEEISKVTTTLKLPGKTTWGSSLDCLNSINDNNFNLKKLAISKHSDRLSKEVKDLILNDAFWQKVAKLIALLKPVIIWLKNIKGDESLIYDAVNMFKDLEAVLKKELLFTTCSMFSFDDAQKLLSELQSRAAMVLTPVHFAANILNPKSRGNHLAPKNYSAGYDIILKLHRKFENVSEQNY